MIDQREVELKLKLMDENTYEDVIKKLLLFNWKDTSEARVSEYETTYYDTLDHRLNQNHLTYRIRKDEGQYTATMKDSGSHEGGLHVRNEWSKILEEDSPFIQPFLDFPIGLNLKEIIGSESLVPIFQTCFRRTTIDLITDQGSKVELAADIGHIISGEKRESLCEIELELKSGRIEDLLKLGAVLSEHFPMVVEEKSKYLRGLILSGFFVPSETEGNQIPELIKEELLEKEIQKILLFCLQEIIRMQEKFLKSPSEPETVHQLRVKTRQLRSLLSFIKPLISQEDYISIQDKLRNLAGRFSYIREIDVLKKEWSKLTKAYSDFLGEPTALRDVLMIERNKEQAELYEQITKGSTTPVLLQIWAWFLESPWKQNTDTLTTLSDFTGMRYKNWYNRIEKGLKKTDFHDLHTTHTLRIQCKKLRYVLNCLEPILKNKQRKTLSRLKDLQEYLGEICDAQRNVAILHELTEKKDCTSLHYHSGILIGFQMSESGRLMEELKNLTKK